MTFDQKGYKKLMGTGLAVYLLLLILVGYPIKIYFAGKKFLKAVLLLERTEEIKGQVISFCMQRFPLTLSKP